MTDSMPDGTPCGHPHLEDRPLASRVWFRFGRAMKLHRQLMMRKVAERGHHPAQALCLGELAHNDGITQRDLADLLHVTRPTVTTMLQKMEKSGLIERRADTDDQRYTRIFVTPQGWTVHAEMHEVIDEVVAEVIGPLSEADQEALGRLLTLMNENLVAALGGSAAVEHHHPNHRERKGACL